MTRLYRRNIHKDINDLDNQDVEVTHLYPDIRESEVKWASGSIIANKDSRDNGIPADLYEMLKYDAAKVLHSTCEQIWKTQQWPQDWKR